MDLGPRLELVAVITRYVDAGSSGGDGTTQKTSGSDAAYASLQAALDAQSADLVTAGDSLVIICGGSTADTEVEDSGTVAWPGMVTSATNNITIQADENHEGVWNNTIYRLESDSYYRVLGIPSDQFVTIVGLQVSNTRSPSGGAGADIFEVVGSGAGAVTLDRALLRHTGTNISGGSGKGVRTSRLTGDCVVTIQNCIAYDCLTNGYQMRVVNTSGGGAIHVLNCTAVNCATGFSVAARSSSGGVGSLRNCIAQGSSNVDFGTGGSGIPGGTWTATNNLSEDATATNVDSDSGATSITSTSLTFRDAAAYDYHLAATDTAAIDAGVDLSSTFTDDIDGVTRTGTWDIGADQYAAAATGGLLGPLVGEGGLAGIGGLVGARGGIAG